MNSFRAQPQKHDTLSKDLGCLILKLKLSLQVFFLSINIFSPLSRSGQTPKKLEEKAAVPILQGAAAGLVSEGHQDSAVPHLK